MKKDNMDKLFEHIYKNESVNEKYSIKKENRYSPCKKAAITAASVLVASSVQASQRSPGVVTETGKLLYAKKAFGIVKQLSIALISFIIMLTALMISYILGWVMYNKLCARVPIAQFDIGTVTTSSSIIIKFIFGYIIALIFAEIGYTLGIIFKNVIVGMIPIIAYMFFLPNLGRFDLKNCIFYFAKKVFDFYGVISVQSPKETSSMAAGLIMLFVVIILVSINIIVLVKRSSFES